MILAKDVSLISKGNTAQNEQFIKLTIWAYPKLCVYTDISTNDIEIESSRTDDVNDFFNEDASNLHLY
jgi:hypothetical protein